MMTVYDPMEIIDPAGRDLHLIEYATEVRRIFTDGRDWPTDRGTVYTGYSIGKWIDTDGDGRYDLLDVETRNFKGPRVYDNHRPAAAPGQRDASSRNASPRQDQSERPARTRSRSSTMR